MYIKNRDEVVEQLTEMLVQFAKDLNCGYQTDVYAYYNEESETVRLDTFINVGGNSYIPDDHITIYSDPEHYDAPIEFFTSVHDIAEALEIDYATLISEVAASTVWSEEEIDIHDVREYVESREDYSDKIYQAYCDFVRYDHWEDYARTAEDIISRLENDEF